MGVTLSDIETGCAIIAARKMSNDVTHMMIFLALARICVAADEFNASLQLAVVSSAHGVHTAAVTPQRLAAASATAHLPTLPTGLSAQCYLQLPLAVLPQQQQQQPLHCRC
jgi:hypothetical protein